MNHEEARKVILDNVLAGRPAFAGTDELLGEEQAAALQELAEHAAAWQAHQQRIELGVAQALANIFESYK